MYVPISCETESGLDEPHKQFRGDGSNINICSRIMNDPLTLLILNVKRQYDLNRVMETVYETYLSDGIAEDNNYAASQRLIRWD